jgi:uncharacterized protein YcaQ
MPASDSTPITLSQSDARRIWLRAQRLDDAAPFGNGAEAVANAVDRLGYVQIDMINVIERSHHHILWTRIPDYRRQHLFFDYGHRFEAYVPKEKRLHGYFALSVPVGDEIVAAIDLTADREQQKLLVQKWTWVGHGSARTHKARIEDGLHRFGRFQFDRR